MTVMIKTDGYRDGIVAVRYNINVQRCCTFVCNGVLTIDDHLGARRWIGLRI